MFLKNYKRDHEWIKVIDTFFSQREKEINKEIYRSIFFIILSFIILLFFIGYFFSGNRVYCLIGLFGGIPWLYLLKYFIKKYKNDQNFKNFNNMQKNNLTSEIQEIPFIFYFGQKLALERRLLNCPPHIKEECIKKFDDKFILND